MITSQQIVDEARRCIGTPWHHAGRLRGVGLDCAGLLVVVMAELGIAIIDDTMYTTGDEFNRMSGHMDVYADRLPIDEPPRPGDVLLFRKGRMLNHCSIFTENHTHIHVFRPLGCVEQLYDEDWAARLVVRYRYKGISE